MSKYLSCSLVICVCTAIFLHEYVQLSILLSVVTGFICICIAFFARKRRRLFCIFMCGAGFFFAWAETVHSETRFNALPHYLSGTETEAVFRICDKKRVYKEKNQSVTVYRADLKSHGGKGSVLLYIHGENPFEEGCVVKGRVSCTAPVFKKNYGTYDFYHAYRYRSIFMKCKEHKDTPLELVELPSMYDASLHSIRLRITDSFTEVMGTRLAYVFTSLLFGGHYDEIDEDIIRNFSLTGMIHILSVSGSHITILLSVIWTLAGGLSLSRRVKLSGASVVLFLYCALAGFTVPVIRSTLTGMAAAYAAEGNCEHSPLHILSLVALFFLAENPFVFYDLSFRLSFCAAAGIILFTPKTEAALSFLPVFLRRCTAVCIGAQIPAVPLLTGTFAGLPLYTLPANLLVGSVLDGLIVAGLVAALAVYIMPFFGRIILHILKPFLWAALKANAFLAALPYSFIPTGSMGDLLTVAYILAVFAVYGTCKRKVAAFCSVFIFSAAVYTNFSHRQDRQLMVLDTLPDYTVYIKEDNGMSKMWYNKKQKFGASCIMSVVAPALHHEAIFSVGEVFLSGQATEKIKTDIQKSFKINVVSGGCPDFTNEEFRICGDGIEFIKTGKKLNVKECGEIRAYEHKGRWHFETYSGETYETY